jgi:hypothetical protein
MTDLDRYDELTENEIDRLAAVTFYSEDGTLGGRLSKFDHHDVAAAEMFLKTSGVLELLDSFDREDGWDERMGGRTQIMHHRHMLIAFLLLAHDRSPLWVREVGKLYRHRLTPKAREMLGLPEANRDLSDRRQRKYWDNAASNGMRRLLRILDPWGGVPRNRLLTRAAREAALKSLDKSVMHVRRERLNTFTGMMLEGTFGLIPRDVRRKLDRVNISVDQTYVSSFSQRGISGLRKGAPGHRIDPMALELEIPREKRDTLVVEAEARWYPKAQKDREGGTKKDEDGKPIATFGWGFGATFGVLAAPDDKTVHVPHIVMGFTLAPANTDIPGEGIRALDQILDRGHGPGHVTTDLGYFAAFPSEILLNPVRRRGWDIVTDYLAHDLVAKNTDSGALIVAGAPTCPALPEHLKIINGDLDAETRENWVRERSRYELPAKESPNPRTGKQRMQCPAHGPAARVLCPLRDKLHGKQPKSGMQPVRLTQKKRKNSELLPIVDVSAIKVPDKVCTQTTVTIDLAETERTSQKYAHGSPEWRDTLRSDRNLVEGANSFLKSPGYEELHQSGRRLVRGLAGQQILITILLVAANIRRIMTFIRDHQDAADLGLPYMRVRKALRRDRIGYGNYTAAARSKDTLALAAAEERTVLNT